MNALVRTALGGALLSIAFAATAQTFPTKPIRIVIPYPPGGGTDVLTRLVGRYLGDQHKQAVIAENRPGANAQIGIDLVSKAPADGYTLMSIAAGPLNEENLKLFAPIALFTAAPYLLVVNPASNIADVKSLIATAKAQPGKLAYGSTGGGAASHLSTELFKAMTGTDMLHVPYKGIGGAITDLLGNQVQLMIAPAQAVMPHVKSGKLRALGVTGRERSPAAPDLPTLHEAGVTGYESAGWFGLVAPATTPREVVTQLNRDVNAILQLAEVKSRMVELGAAPAALSPEQFLEFIRQDNAKWAKLIRERGLVIEGAK